MIYNKKSYIHADELEKIILEFQRSLDSFDNDQFLKDIFTSENSSSDELEFFWVYENKLNCSIKSNFKNYNKLPSPLWVGTGEYLYIRVYYPEEKINFYNMRSYFDRFIQDISKLPGILRVNYFRIKNISIVDHKDDQEFIEGYQTFVASLHNFNQSLHHLNFKVEKTHIDLGKNPHFFYDVNAVHSAANLSNFWWSILTIDIDNEQLVIKL